MKFLSQYKHINLVILILSICHNSVSIEFDVIIISFFDVKTRPRIIKAKNIKNFWYVFPRNSLAYFIIRLNGELRRVHT